MLVELGNGKTVSMSLEYFLEMTEDGYQQMIAADMGEHINDPFFDSVLRETSDEAWWITGGDRAAVPDELDLTEIDSLEKYIDLDLEPTYDD